MPLCAHLNFFQPQRRLLLGKERHGATVVKRYDQAQTPYHRLLAADVLLSAERICLTRRYAQLNPLQLQAELDAALDHLWSLADHTVGLTPAQPEGADA